MRLLIVTQAVDARDPVLGFFVRWIEEFAKRYERIEVICLKEGEHALPANVRVHSLGKPRFAKASQGTGARFRYVYRFLKLVWELRHNYDAVFVHMNQEYLLIAGWLWKLLGKRMYMWRNHYAGSLLTDLAAAFCTNVFCTSKYSYTAKYAKTVLMPVGIDTTFFAPAGNRVPRSILFLARIAPAKRPDVLIEALGILATQNVDFTASLYGDAAPRDQGYLEQLKLRALALGLSSHAEFKGAVDSRETPAVYSAHEICVNVSPSGMYDKTIFEAAACGALSLTSNQNLSGLVDGRLLFTEGDAADLAQKLAQLLRMREEEKHALRTQLQTLVAERHSLRLLGEELARRIV